MKFIRIISPLKFLATIFILFFAGAYEYLLAFCSFTIPYSFAVLFDDVVADRFGKLIVIYLGIYLLVSCIALILIRIRNDVMNITGLGCIIGISISDIACAVLSCAETIHPAKIINIILCVMFIAYTIFVAKSEIL